jgi:hypothetical protein
LLGDQPPGLFGRQPLLEIGNASGCIYRLHGRILALVPREPQRCINVSHTTVSRLNNVSVACLNGIDPVTGASIARAHARERAPVRTPA